MNKIVLTLCLLASTIISFAQNSNPYKAFGYTSKVRYETRVKELLYIRNKDTASKIRAIAFDIENSYAIILGAKETILYKVKLEPDQIVRWMSVDPLADKYQSFSPYNFTLNNPIIYIDPDGREVKNGMQDNLNSAQARVNAAQSAIDNADKNISSKDLKRLNKELKSANGNLNDAQSLFNKAQNSIDLVKNVDPDYFNKINTLKDKGGNDVNVYVTATNDFGRQGDGATLKKGETSLIFKTVGNQPYTQNGINNEPYVQFFTTPQATEIGFTITLFGSATQSTIANEFGNVEFSTNNSILDATQQMQQVPYAQKAGEIYSFKVQAQFEAKLKLLKAKQ